MVNWRTGEFVMFDGATWQGRGANFLYHYLGHRQSRTLNSKRDKVGNIKKKVFSSCSIMFLEHHFQKDFDDDLMNYDENKFIAKRS